MWKKKWIENGCVSFAFKYMFTVKGLKILGRVGTHIFFNYLFFLEKNIILCILKGFLPFKMHKIILFFRKPEKNSRFHH